ncbi:alpha/beta hydrolase [Hartmannibacter diazotrophicus]|uniref:alpha/beta hydrolase n=1 Tax=Hartmannibacter diazotrophicus TaxID=1482074 RepID=UPI0031835D98
MFPTTLAIATLARHLFEETGASKAMTGDGDLFQGFDTETIKIDEARIHLRLGGEGQPVLLLHGYPQTHAMWHRIAGELAQTHRLIIPDIPGYGRSTTSEGGPPHTAHSKRRMGEILVRLMGQLGHERFAVIGHDRGGRVGYRMALDYPDRVARLAVLDILPTLDYWEAMDRAFALKVYHWPFLAQPAPLPEHLIGADPVFYLDWTIASWTASRDLSAFDPRVIADYRTAFSNPSVIHAACEDYRAGATIDVEYDRQDRDEGRRILCPLLAIWGKAGIPSHDGEADDGEADDGGGVLSVWRRWALDVRGTGVNAGHFVAEENPVETLAALSPFLMDYAMEALLT